jgi:hypothetical protein
LSLREVVDELSEPDIDVIISEGNVDTHPLPQLNDMVLQLINLLI